VAQGKAHYKDEILNRLAARANVAQFISFGPDLRQRHSWINGRRPNKRFRSPEEGVTALLAASPESSVNIRSFEPDNPKSRDFLYGLKSVTEVMEGLRRLAGKGSHYDSKRNH